MIVSAGNSIGELECGLAQPSLSDLICSYPFLDIRPLDIVHYGHHYDGEFSKTMNHASKYILYKPTPLHQNNQIKKVTNISAQSQGIGPTPIYDSCRRQSCSVDIALRTQC